MEVIYRYDPVYKTYTSSSPFQKLEGTYPPPYTTLQKPPECKAGEIARFNEATQLWEKIEDTINHIQYELCFATYQFNKTHPINEIPTLFKIDNPNNGGDNFFQHIIPFLDPLTKLYRYTSKDSIAFKLANRIYFLNNKIRELYVCHEKILTNLLFFPSQLACLDFEICEIIHGIKRVLDIITISAYLDSTKLPTFLDIDHKIPCDGIKFLLTNERNEAKFEIFEKTLFHQYKDLYRTLNDIHNAYKHDILCESMSLGIFTEPCVSITRFRKQDKNLKNIRHYSIELRKIIFACNDLLNFILKGENADNAPKFTLIRTLTQPINTDNP